MGCLPTDSASEGDWEEDLTPQQQQQRAVGEVDAVATCVKNLKIAYGSIDAAFEGVWQGMAGLLSSDAKMCAMC
jgi:hypothetical protein